MFANWVSIKLIVLLAASFFRSRLSSRNVWASLLIKSISLSGFSPTSDISSTDEPSTTYWNQNYYFYLMTPANKTLKFNYNGKACEITFADYMANSSYGYLYPQIQYYNKKSSINFVVKSVKVGDDQIDVNTVFQAVGKQTN